MNEKSIDPAVRTGIGMSSKQISAAAIFARLALSTSFLSAVADRFGIWGPPGAGTVAWGTFDRFLQYVQQLTPYLSGTLVEIAGWGSTLVELGVGVALLLGLAVRASALLGMATLMVFGLSMFFFNGFEVPFSYSVFTAASAAAFLALIPPDANRLSLDNVLRVRAGRAVRSKRG